MKLIVGLGNPGKQYEHTRHNAGFFVIDALLNNEVLINKNKLQAEVVKTEIDGKRVLLARPTTFMNLSGVPVQLLLNFFKLKPVNLIIIHDDKDIPLGEIRVQVGRGAAGHNGVLSIIEQIGTKNFTRIRVGVAPMDKKIVDTANFVLGKFTAAEMKILKNVLPHVHNEIHKLLA